jgi:hypothetical protein
MFVAPDIYRPFLLLFLVHGLYSGCHAFGNFPLGKTFSIDHHVRLLIQRLPLGSLFSQLIYSSKAVQTFLELGPAVLGA